MTIPSGTKLGRYEIRSKLGEAGMGKVYVDRDKVFKFTHTWRKTGKSGTGFEASAPVPLFEFRPGGNLITPYYSVTKDERKFLLSTIVDTEAAAPLTVVVNWATEVKR